MSEYSPKKTWRPYECSQLSAMYCAIWLVDFWPITILDINLIALFYVFQSRTALIRALNPFLFYFPIWHLKTNKINEKVLKKGTLGISRKIWCSNLETKSVTKAAQCKLIKFFLLAIARSNSPLFLYTVCNGIKPLWDVVAFPKLIIFLKN